MKTKEMIEALKSLDPNVPAGDAIKAVRAQAAKARLAALRTHDGIRAEHGRLLAHARTHKDSKGNGNDDPHKVAHDAVRTEVMNAVQQANPPPTELAKAVYDALPNDESRRIVLHEIQKAHNIKLWEEADALVAAAGVAPKGEN